MKIAVLGSGAREHALARRLGESSHVVSVYPGADCIVGSTGIAWNDPQRLASALRAEAVDLVVVGPEQPLSEGVADNLRQAGFWVLGPGQAGARLETSKAFAKAFMVRHAIPTAKHRAFANVASARAHIDAEASACVIKLDGLAAGKGVFVCNSVQAARAALDEVALRFGVDASVLVEEVLVGREVSVIAVVADGEVVLLPPAQDHKRLLDGDHGPNTGGMGAYCPVPWCGPAMLEQIRSELVLPTVRGLVADGCSYRGLLYFGVMVTPQGPKLLEYNARFGDPEAQVVLPQIDGDVGELFLAAAKGSLGGLPVVTRPGFTVGIVLASEAYPEAAKENEVINGLELDDLCMVHAATKRVSAEGGQGSVVTNGGRVLTALGRGATFASARAAAYAKAQGIAFRGMQYRRDIGGQAEPKRVAVLFSGRGSNMAALLSAMREGGILAGFAEPCVAVTNRPEAVGIPIAKEGGVEVRVLPSKGTSAESYDIELATLLRSYAPDYVLLAGFMKVLGQRTVATFAQRIVNVHPADTKEHQGLHGYEWALAQRLEETYVTVHLVDEGLDTGKVLSKTRVDLREADTLDEVVRRGLAVEHEAYARTFRDLLLTQGNL
jgi:phosphoribosylamine---glycine ligase